MNVKGRISLCVIVGIILPVSVYYVQWKYTDYKRNNLKTNYNSQPRLEYCYVITLLCNWLVMQCMSMWTAHNSWKLLRYSVWVLLGRREKGFSRFKCLRRQHTLCCGFDIHMFVHHKYISELQPTRRKRFLIYLFLQMLYMFQAVPPPIIGSTKLYIQLQVLSTNTAASM